MEFAYPWVLYLLWLAPALAAGWFAAERRHQRRLDLFLTPAMQQKLAPAVSRRQRQIQAALLWGGITLCLVALARPQWGQREETIYQRGRDIIIALDVSRSMLATDVHPNRLQRAKTDVQDLIQELRGDRAGLLAFRRKATLVCPLTTDYAYLRQALEATSPDAAPRGETDMGDAIRKALDSFDTAGSSHKAIVLISDGEDLSGRVKEAAEEAAKRKITIFTVGLGDRRGSRIPDENAPGRYVEHGGSAVVTKLNNDVLFEIAKTTGGIYLPVETAGMTRHTLGTIYRDHLRNIQAREMAESRQRRRVDRFPLFLLPGVLLLIGAGSLSRGRLAIRRGKTITATTPAAVALMVFMASSPAIRAQPPAMPLQTSATTQASAPDAPVEPAEAAASNAVANIPPGVEGARLAQRLYDRGRYREAADAYLHAAQNVASPSAQIFNYNAAAALFKDGQYRKAADELDAVLPATPAARRADVAAGMGASYFALAESRTETNQPAAQRAANLKSAAEAFKTAARLSTDPRQRGNMDTATGQLPEAEKQAKIETLTARYAQTQPEQIAREMLDRQRRANEDMMKCATNTEPSRIHELETLADQQKETADLWIPLKGKLMAAMQANAKDTNAMQQAAMASQTIEATRDNMLKTASQLEDMEADPLEAAAISEAAVYHLWKSIAPFDPLLREDLYQQTNVVAELGRLIRCEPADIRLAQQRQQEAGELTRLFVERFTNAVPPEGLAAQPAPEAAAATNDATPGGSSTNEMAITAENRQKILELADQARAAQAQAADALQKNESAAAQPFAQAAETALKEIEKLLPKSKQQQQQKQDQQQQQKPQDSKQEQKPEPKDQKQEQPKPSEEKKPEKQQPEEVKRMLEKALQREKEHEEEVRERNRKIPPSPTERDW